jgi:hypothetical protein
MAFKKDGETKVFISRPSRKGKVASDEPKIRYTVDDLVEDSETTAVKTAEDESEEQEDVSDQA